MDRVFNDIKDELDRAGAKYAPTFNSLNEALGTIRAEYRELEDTIVQHQSPENIREEAIQVAAMAVKLIEFLEREQKAEMTVAGLMQSLTNTPTICSSCKYKDDCCTWATGGRCYLLILADRKRGRNG